MFDATGLDAPQDFNERRVDRRQRTFLQGKIIFATNSLSSHCSIRNLSQSGAQVSWSDAISYPSDTILVAVKSGMAYEATTIWSKNDDRGLSFEKTFDLNVQVPPRLSYAYKLWIENLPR